MGILDWLRTPEPDPPKGGISRRDFFARVAGQGSPVEPPPAEDAGALYTFYVSRFPFHDGPVLVPILRQGMEFRLVPDPGHLTDPTAVRIQWGKDNLGYVPPEHSADVRRRLANREKLHCTSLSVDPSADLPRVLRVEIRAEPEPPTVEEEDESPDEPHVDPAEGAEPGETA